MRNSTIISNIENTLVTFGDGVNGQCRLTREGIKSWKAVNGARTGLRNAHDKGRMVVLFSRMPVNLEADVREKLTDLGFSFDVLICGAGRTDFDVIANKARKVTHVAVTRENAGAKIGEHFGVSTKLAAATN